MTRSEIKNIFVFGSNLAGRHGAGSAKEALDWHGATYGVGVVPQGHAYAIPTKDENFNVLPLSTIGKYVLEFLLYARENKDCQFNVVEVGCGLAGYGPEDIAPLFVGKIPENVKLPKSFVKVLEKD